jgi:CDP-diacylglycerol--glycerol-3-phosphate 3-phosphatidyltransferase
MKISELFTGRIFTISNFLSILRIFLIPLFGYLIYYEHNTGLVIYRHYAIIVMTIMISTDFFDGYTARLLNQVSRLGQFLDPISDKICSISVMVLLIYYKDYPVWILIILLCRDLFAILGGFIIYSKNDIQVRPNTFGKLMVTFMGLSGYIYILSPSFSISGISLQTVSIILVLIFAVLSTIEYWKTYSIVYYDNK